MDALSPGNKIQIVVFIKGAQIGGSEIGNNWTGYNIDYAPGPMMIVQPTVDLAKRFSKQRISTMIEATPRLREKAGKVKSRDSGNTILQKDFPGCTIVFSGANSAASLRSLPARYSFLDEIDAYPEDVEGEGDPVELVAARSRTFPRRKSFRVSTPTFEGRSKIQKEWEASDKRRYHVPCPHCDHYQWLKWAQIKWPLGKPYEAVYVCESCEQPISEHHKTKMLARGKWIAENPGAGGGRVAGFHLSALYSPVGWYSWGEAANDWEKAQGNLEKLRSFVNTVLGETWKEKSETPDKKRLWERRETYQQNTVPAGVMFLTAGTDVQKDRIEVEIVGWGRNKESWSIDYRVIEGDTATDAPWLKLTKMLGEVWRHENGVEFGIMMMAVDTGYNTQHVYNWIRNQPIGRVMAVKGYDEGVSILSNPTYVDLNFGGKKVKRGVQLWKVGTNHTKSELYAWLNLPKPSDGDPYPDGYCHFPQYNEDYFAQITAEQIVVRIVRGYRKYVWMKIGRNEALDCRVYARAAAARVGLDRFSDDQWDELAEELAARPEAPEPVSTAQSTDTSNAKARNYWKGRRR